MNFNAVEIQGINLGFECILKNHIVFFGNKNGTLENLKLKYPNFKFSKMHQVHGSRLIEAHPGNNNPEADAQWSTTNNLALVVSTADCIPILIAHPSFVCAIHAGWRGLDSEIVIKALKFLQKKSYKIDDLRFFIGPHIFLNSYEVDSSLVSKFQSAIENNYISSKLNDLVDGPLSLQHASKTKRYLSLINILYYQLSYLGIKKHQILNLPINTFTSEDFASHRADPANNIRNLSFVARLTK